jgi:hypothetical protein
MAGLVPAISFRGARCPPKRGHRDKPGDDELSYFPAIAFWQASHTFAGVAGMSM